MDSIDYNINQVGKIVGCKIIGAISEGSNGHYGFMVERPDGTLKKVWVLRDKEGNGPGILNIEN